MMGNEKGHTQGIIWSVEHAQTKNMKVELCDGIISSQRLHDSSSSSSRGASEQYRYKKQIKKIAAAAHLSARHREGDEEKLSDCFHGETLERQPQMFDKAPEKRSLNRYTV